MAKKKTKASNAGRKNKYHTHILPYLQEIKFWIRSGMTENSIAAKLGVSHDTWYRYKKEHSEFFDAVKQGHEKTNALVFDKLLQRIQGMEVKEEEFRTDEEGNIIERKIKRKELPPDVAAIQFYLRNRIPELFNTAEKQEISHSGGVDFKNVSTEELQERLKKLRGE